MAPAHAQIMLAQHCPAQCARVPVCGMGITGVASPHHLFAGSEARCGDPGVWLGGGTVLTDVQAAECGCWGVGAATVGCGAQLSLWGASHANAVPGEAPGFSQEQLWETSQLLRGCCY